MKLLGIDYGSKRIGLALGDTETRMAAPWKTVESRDDVVRAVLEEQVGMIVVGLPLTMKGEEGPQAKEVQDFVEVLKERVAIPIETVDERLTSQFADRFAAAFGPHFDRDAVSAAAILQTYLDVLTRRSNE